MQVISPRDSAGLRMLAASSEPSAEPVPISEWISSMKMMISRRSLQLLEQALQPLLELATVLGPGHQQREIEGEDPPVCEQRRHVALDDASREPLDDRGLADAGIAEQQRVVLGAPAEDLDHPLDLVVAADQRVEAALHRQRGEVPRVLAMWGVACGRCPRPRARGPAARPPRAAGRARSRGRPGSWAAVEFSSAEQAQQQVLGADRSRGPCSRPRGPRTPGPSWCPRPAADPATCWRVRAPRRSPSSSLRRSLTLASTRWRGGSDIASSASRSIPSSRCSVPMARLEDRLAS